MDIIKKNIALFIFLSLALLCSAALVYVIYLKHDEMSKSMHEVEKIKEDIQNLMKESPAPLKENLDMMKQDVKSLKGRLADVYGIFGKPYKKALSALAAELDIPVAELETKFRDFYAKEIAAGQSKYQALHKFFAVKAPESKEPEQTAADKAADKGKDAAKDKQPPKGKDADKDKDKAAAKDKQPPKDKESPQDEKFDKVKLEKGMIAFQKAIQEETSEVINADNIYDYLLAALDLPRNMSDVNCKRYMSEMQTTVGANLKKSVAAGSPEVLKFTFGEYENKMPLPENIPYIIRHWIMIDDLVKRIEKSGVRQLDMINRINLLQGEDDKIFLKFRYSISVTGSLDSIRQLCNMLQSAYKDNRIYIIRDINLELAVDDCTKLLDEKIQAAGRPEEPAAPGGKPKIAKPSEIEPVLGVNNTCKAVIEFEYIIHIGDEIKEKR
jgi:Tfp pilus assembly protein PilO